METGKKLIEQPNPDVQSYQLLGMAYKAIAKYKEGEKLYKSALQKFPKSGVLYSEYGDLLMSDNNKTEAIQAWEKGIEADANISSNYYYASKYYAKTGNIIWGLLYGEIFINIESLSNRTTEIKEQLLNGYKKLYENRNTINALSNKQSAFQNAVVESFSKLTSMMKPPVTAESLTALRTRFILEWFNGPAKNFRFRLFDYQQQLLQQGYFEPYNQWVFGEIINKDRFNNWVFTHESEMSRFKQFQRTSLFKVPEGQYQPH